MWSQVRDRLNLFNLYCTPNTPKGNIALVNSYSRRSSARAALAFYSIEHPDKSWWVETVMPDRVPPPLKKGLPR